MYDELSETDKKKVDASRIDNLLKLNALSVMSPEESDHFAKTTLENIIPTNMLDKWKLHDDGTVAAKSRSEMVGWKDPMIYQLERLIPKVGPGQLLRVETEIYGLVSGPSWLRASLIVDLLAAGYTNACSHCSLPMRHRKANCCSMLTTSQKGVRRLTARPWRETMTNTVVVRRSTSCRQDKRVHGSPGGVSCNTLIFASLCRWTNMSDPSSVQFKFQEDTRQTPRR